MNKPPKIYWAWMAKFSLVSGLGVGVQIRGRNSFCTRESWWLGRQPVPAKIIKEVTSGQQVEEGGKTGPENRVRHLPKSTRHTRKEM